jgi:hypothetical protein
LVAWFIYNRVVMNFSNLDFVFERASSLDRIEKV